tara:strand:- start:1115 stop:1282 length:168 start_codon:yes stop_codon:yes gene_type:complete
MPKEDQDALFYNINDIDDDTKKLVKEVVTACGKQRVHNESITREEVMDIVREYVK